MIEKEKNLKEILDELPEGVLIMDKNKDIKYSNHVFNSFLDG